MLSLAELVGTYERWGARSLGSPQGAASRYAASLLQWAGRGLPAPSTSYHAMGVIALSGRGRSSGATRPYVEIQNAGLAPQKRINPLLE